MDFCLWKIRTMTPENGIYVMSFLFYGSLQASKTFWFRLRKDCGLVKHREIAGYICKTVNKPQFDS